MIFVKKCLDKRIFESKNVVIVEKTKKNAKLLTGMIFQKKCSFNKYTKSTMQKLVNFSKKMPR